MTKHKATRNRVGMLPGESKRRSLVAVERVTQPNEVGDEGDLTIVDNYIVTTRRLDGIWSHVVELRGQRTLLPDRVVLAINRHRESIVTEERSRRARERILSQAQAVVEAQG